MEEKTIYRVYYKDALTGLVKGFDSFKSHYEAAVYDFNGFHPESDPIGFRRGSPSSIDKAEVLTLKPINPGEMHLSIQDPDKFHHFEFTFNSDAGLSKFSTINKSYEDALNAFISHAGPMSHWSVELIENSYVIYAKSQDEFDDIPLNGFWTVEDGWGHVSDAMTYLSSEVADSNVLPSIGVSDALRISVENIHHYFSKCK